MQITQAELTRYRLQLAQQQADAKAYVIARLESEPGIREMPVADVRNKTIEIMQDCLGVFGDQAQALSAELFDEISEAEGLGADPAQIFDGLIDGDKMEEKVRYYVRAIAGEELDWEGYEGSSADLASYYVHRSAMQNMARNCSRNDVRYARVPTGRETCSWCYMLASRDFDYRSEQSAGAASHDGCDCIVVPGVKGVTKISGYDPDGMRRRMGVIEDHTGLRFGEDRKQMDALTREMGGMERDWLYKGKGQFAWTPYKVRSAKHDNGAAYTKDEQKIAAEIELHGTAGSPFSSSDLKWTGKGFARHVREHGSEFGVDPSKSEDRARYSTITNNVIDGCDALTYGDWYGQKNELCLYYFNGDTIVIVNADTEHIVSAMRFERGRNAKLTSIWDSVHK